MNDIAKDTISHYLPVGVQFGEALTPELLRAILSNYDDMVRPRTVVIDSGALDVVALTGEIYRQKQRHELRKQQDQEHQAAQDYRDSPARRTVFRKT